MSYFAAGRDHRLTMRLPEITSVVSWLKLGISGTCGSESSRLASEYVTHLINSAGCTYTGIILKKLAHPEISISTR